MQAKSKAAKAPSGKNKRSSAKPAAAKVAPTSAKSKQKPVADTGPAEVAKPHVKLVRDSFTMPREDWDLIQYLKERTLAFKRPTKKSELLRAGLQALVGLSDAKLQAALEKLTPLKAGRPKGLGK